MTSLSIPPGLVLILGGLLLPLLGGWLRACAVLALPLLTLWLVTQVPDGNVLEVRFLGFDLVPLKGDKLSRLFAFVFALMAFVGALYALRQERTTELAAAFVYAGSAIGVALAGDLISVFVVWEIMAICSVACC
jgi:multicomponent Na+:H+ antiporter subunit D